MVNRVSSRVDSRVELLLVCQLKGRVLNHPLFPPELQLGFQVELLHRGQVYVQLHYLQEALRGNHRPNQVTHPLRYLQTLPRERHQPLPRVFQQVLLVESHQGFHLYHHLQLLVEDRPVCHLKFLLRNLPVLLRVDRCV